jgi:F-type H+-transporting ATPase subunit b
MEEFHCALRRKSADIIQSVARRALKDLADAELQSEMLRVFLSRLKPLDERTRRALLDSDEAWEVASSHVLSPRQRARMIEAVREHLDPDAEVEFTHAPRLLCGLELSRGGRTVGWSVDQVIDRLSTKLEDGFGHLEPLHEVAG